MVDRQGHEEEPIAKQGESSQVEVDGREIALTNLDKVLWPAAGFTKAQAIDYYARVAETILPHLRGRPLTRVRFPDGTESQRFYEKRAPSHTPDWVETAAIEMGTAGVIDFIVCDDKPTLIWLAQLAALELHPSLALAADPDRPTVVAFDLDPGAPASIVECARIALRLRELFDRLGVEAFPKTSGSKGLQIYLPLNGDVDFDATKDFARAVAQALERSEPELVVSRQKKELRKGKVLVDWGQNDRAKTTVAVYSLRCRERPWVSTPLTWDEVEALAEEGDPEAVRFEAADVIERIDDHGDLFAPVLELEQALPAAAPAA
ncbi:MAG TPA: non-homologous end-joining DNA ligase [Solirubrobacterales bacterium]|nr:non-homologous end-joining DNA ligase [Solirubrobacterales bacterium]